MTARSAHTFENRFNGGNEVQDSQIKFNLEQPISPDLVSRIWTLVDPNVPSGMQFFVPGVQAVNRVGFFISKVPWKPADVFDEFRRW